MNVEISVYAKRQLESIHKFLCNKNEKAAVKTYNSILDGIYRLADFPQMAAIEPLLADFARTYRSLVIKNTYKVVYYIEGDVVYIATVIDCRQNPNKLRYDIIKGKL
jgi:plasmid stabilization system protein ParE